MKQYILSTFSLLALTTSSLTLASDSKEEIVEAPKRGNYYYQLHNDLIKSQDRRLYSRETKQELAQAHYQKQANEFNAYQLQIGSAILKVKMGSPEEKVLRLFSNTLNTKLDKANVRKMRVGESLSSETQTMQDTGLEGKFASYFNKGDYGSAIAHAQLKERVYQGYHKALQPLVQPLAEEAYLKNKTSSYQNAIDFSKVFFNKSIKAHEAVISALYKFASYDSLQECNGKAKEMVENYKNAKIASLPPTPDLLTWLKEKEQKWRGLEEDALNTSGNKASLDLYQILLALESPADITFE